MSPLAFHHVVAAVLLFGGTAVWGVSEVVFAARRTGTGGDADRSHIPLFATAFACVGLAMAVSPLGPSLPGGARWPLITGLVIFAVAVAYRIWAIRTLGRFFVFNVDVQADQQVVDTGPYALTRHPSYLGLIGALLGLGLALDNWPSLVLAFVPPAVGFVHRIHVEEGVLATELGQPYRDYMARTKRLIPGVW
ncbi:methyltransferase family protein [Luteipulveratus mongoliensis]|uniref:methyltransferase family protein n=1 Tax=Luteipulveratus mongoliensis TaxID=571913 RepID=UPI001FDF81DB|nr:isoprenylcysteine carboxylmethyltransferase family protein [Luteipulveratus mongoliensis]